MPTMPIPERYTAIPLLSWLDSSLSPHTPTFNPRQAHVEFVVGKLTLGHIVLQVLQFSFPLSLFCSTSLSIIPLLI